ncbi:MAG TPA: tetratricopeptide repeat protein [Blastocatellia bacterium]|nr:tetratricopeptide repeat protein [Blastocatellia bacterium]
MPRIFILFALALVVLFSCTVLAQSNLALAGDSKQQAAALFDEGQTAQEKGNLNTAVRLYSRAITSDPDLYQAYYQRAIAQIALDERAEAEQDLRKVIEIEPGFARAHRALGELLLDRGITAEAKRELGRALELDPKLKNVRVDYATALIGTGEPALAVEQLHSAIEQGEGTAAAFAMLGLAEERSGKADQAMLDYSHALELNTNEVVAREGRARVEDAHGDTAKAIDDYTKAYKQTPSPGVALKLAGLYLRLGQASAAIEIYREQLRQRPNDLGLRSDMLRLMIDNGQSAQAQTEVTGLLKLRPRDFFLLMLAGDAYSKDKPEVAAGYYKTAIEVNPSNNSARVQLGASMVRSHQFQEAVPLLAEAIRAEPDNMQAHTNLATALFELKQYPQSAEQFVWIVQRKPNLAVAHYFLAISVDRLGDCYDAMRQYRDFVALADPHVNDKEIEDANIRLSLLVKLDKRGKCRPLEGGKKK